MERSRSTQFSGTTKQADDYDVQFEVRKMEHPDLSVVAMQVYDLPGGPFKLVCATIANVGPVDVGPFEVSCRPGPIDRRLIPWGTPRGK